MFLSSVHVPRRRSMSSARQEALDRKLVDAVEQNSHAEVEQLLALKANPAHLTVSVHLSSQLKQTHETFTASLLPSLLSLPQSLMILHVQLIQETGVTPLVLACENNFVKILDVLIQARADLDVPQCQVSGDLVNFFVVRWYTLSRCSPL